MNSVINKRRKELKITIPRLAKRVGVSESTIKRWMNKSLSPDCWQVIKLSKTLNMGVTQIVNDYNKE